MTFPDALDRVLGIEGGFTDDPLDSGGATRYGITERVARKHGYGGPMDSLPKQMVSTIYRKEYWETMNLDNVNSKSVAIAYELFDSGVNVGPRRASEWLQRCLNALNSNGEAYADIKVDGDIGPRTLVALKSYLAWRGGQGEVVLLRGLNALQGEFYISLSERRPKDERFVYGWLLQRVS